MGLRSQIGVAPESTYGTVVAPTRFFEFVREGLERRNRTITSNAIRASGRKLRSSSRRVLTGNDGGGTVDLEVGPDGFGLLFEHMLGDVATTGAGPDFTHTFSLGSLVGKSLTVQKGVEREDGTVVPFDFVGAKITDWTLGIDVDGFTTLGLTFDARDVETDGTLATPSYTDGTVFNFLSSTLSLGGSPVAKVESCEIAGNNSLRTDRYYLGSSGLKDEPRPNGYPTVTGTMEASFLDNATMYDAFAADSPLELVLGFTGADLGGGVFEELSVTLGAIRLTGGTPTVDSMEVPTVPAPFEGFDDGIAEGIEVALTNADSTP